MTTKIRLLDDHTINKIAAGEVIANPSSVVKELIDNSLDAGSTEITIEIKAGGRQLIKVVDNGCGMSEDDALLSLERHATSKISHVNDLNSLSTMGFRGEAVPSIASISKFTLLTSEGDDSTKATMLLVEGGKIIKCCPAARARGTTTEVKSLFYNLPVRKKFLRSINYDSGEIHKVVDSYAIGNPHIRFKLINNENIILTTSPWPKEQELEGMGERTQQLLGNEYFSSLQPLSYEEGPYKIIGYIGDATHAKQNRKGQYLFINKRLITSNFISSIISEAYGTRLATQRFPLFVLNIYMPGELVDVNVHPQKKEVRLQNNIPLKQILTRAIQQTLLNPAKKTASKTANITQPESLPWDHQTISPAFSIEKEESPTLAAQIFKAPSSTTRFQQTELPLKINQTTIENLPHEKIHISTTINGYFIATKPNERNALFIIDQRRAHARITYENLLKNEKLYTDSAQVDSMSQSFLIPITLELLPREKTLLEENLPILQRMGFSIQHFGGQTFIIDALPTFLENLDSEAFIKNILYQSTEIDKQNLLNQTKEKKVALAASYSAINKSQRLSIQEAQTVANHLMACDTPHQCPRGKPTILSLDKDFFASQFQK